MQKVFFYILTGITCIFLLSACQKEVDGSVDAGSTPAVLKPKVGTVWEYRYYTYLSNGGVSTMDYIKHRAASEEEHAGEKWLKIVDVNTDTTVYLLKEKADGLYIFTNNQPYLLCKNPAVVNEQYNSFFRGSAENITVIAVNDTLVTNLGDIPVKFYEGKKAGLLSDNIWYNVNAWIVRAYTFRKPPLSTAPPYRNSGLFLDSITY